MKKFIKNNLIGFIIGISFACLGVYATTLIASNDVTYDNSSSGLTSTTVKGALDELYEMSLSHCPTGYECTKIPYYAYADMDEYNEGKYYAADTDIMTIPGITNNYTTIEQNTFIKFEGPEKSVCAIINGNLECFKNNNYENEKVHLQSIFDEEECTDYGSDFRCFDDAWSCYVVSDGDVGCSDYSTDDYCGLIGDGSFGCFVMPY